MLPSLRTTQNPTRGNSTLLAFKPDWEQKTGNGIKHKWSRHALYYAG